MKPETLARRAADRERAELARRADLVARLQAKAAAAEPGSIWAELLAFEVARQSAARIRS